MNNEKMYYGLISLKFLMLSILRFMNSKDPQYVKYRRQIDKLSDLVNTIETRRGFSK